MGKKLSPGDPVLLFWRKPFQEYEKANCEIESAEFIPLFPDEKDSPTTLVFTLKDIDGQFSQNENMRDRFDKLPVTMGGWYFVRK